MKLETTEAPLSALDAHQRMRHAWFALRIYVLTYLFFATCFEWSAYHWGRIEDIVLFPQGIFYWVALITGTIACVKSLVKRAFAPALIYALIASSVLILGFTYYSRLAFSMELKARIFAAYPNLCQTPIVPNQSVSLCYAYSIEMVLGESEAIYFNPKDEMSLPPRQWPDDLKREFGIKDINSEGYLCSVRKTKRIVDHVYWMSDDCWRH